MISGVFHDADEPPGSLDPHIWLDFDNAKIMADNIAQAMQNADPANTTFYKQRVEDYNNTLSQIDLNYRNSLATCKQKKSSMAAITPSAIWQTATA